jgi:serine protease Do
MFVMGHTVCPAQQTEQTENKAASKYPVVVLERDANFSIPNAKTAPAVSRPPVTPEPFLPKEIYKRTSQSILDATELIAEGFDQSVVSVMHKDERVALGTVVSLRGHVLTKYSLVQDAAENQIRFAAKEQVWLGTLVGFDKKDDLALFALHSGTQRPERILRPIAFTTAGRLKNGKMVIGVGINSKSLAVGTTTAPPSRKAIMDSECETCIDMGLTLGQTMTLTRVYPRTVGERLGLLVGDRIVAVNRKPIQSPTEFQKLEKEIQAGDLISIQYQRNGTLFEITEKVPELTKVSKRDRWGGGPFSKRRNGFSEVIVHDSVIEPVDCGGPLVNLQGQFCGINIARSMRVASLAIPAQPLQEFLLRYLTATDLIIE